MIALAGGIERVEHRVAGAGRDRLADAGGLDDSGGTDQLARQVARAVEARGRAGAQIGEDMAGRAVIDEIEPGRCARMGRDMAVVDTFALPQAADRMAGAVIAERPEIADRHALARRRDRAVRGIAAMTEQEGTALGAGRVELAERFAEAKEIEAAIGHVSNHSDGAGTPGNTAFLEHRMAK